MATRKTGSNKASRKVEAPPPPRQRILRDMGYTMVLNYSDGVRAQQSIINSGISPLAIDRMDYYEVLELAKSNQGISTRKSAA